MSSMSFSEKMGLAVGSASLALAPMAADAALVTVNSSLKISLSDADGTVVNWDVDGTGLHEFELDLRKQAGGGPFFGYGATSVFLASQNATGTQLNGRGFVGLDASSDTARVLNASFNVGQTLASPYTFGLTNQRFRPLLKRSFSQSSYIVPGFSTSGIFLGDINLAEGSNFIGFRFEAGSGLQYGWAEMLLDLTLDAEFIEITQWTYGDVPGESVHVGSIAPPPVPEVPLPASILPALTLLGLGAAGMRTLRRRREAEAAKAA